MYPEARGVRPDNKVIQSYVFYKDKAFMVSTIDRDYEVYTGRIRGYETLVWEWDAKTRERGKILYQANKLSDHFNICQQLLTSGEYKEDDE
jgi:hypothetical protein